MGHVYTGSGLELQSKAVLRLQVKPEGEILKCGDWIRVGNAELVVRFCGGYCKASRQVQLAKTTKHLF